MALKPTWLPQWLWAQTYDGNIAGFVIAPPGVYPTPIYEFGMALGLFWVLWRLRWHNHAAGYLLSVYLLLAGFERLGIEKIRINTRYEVFGVDVSQAEVISFLLIFTSLFGVLATLRTNTRVSV